MRKTLSLSLSMLLSLSSAGAWADDGAPKGFYWFDCGQKTAFTPGSFEVDAKDLPEGLHTFNAFVEAKGVQSTTVSRWFVKTPYIIGDASYKAIISIDGSDYATSTIDPEGGLFNLNLDCNKLPAGIHTISAQIITPSGVPAAFQNGFFYRVPSSAELSTLHGYYCIDGIYHGDLEPGISDRLYHLDIDASKLSSGLHSISVFMASPFGLATPLQTSWFIKIPNGGEGVVSYEYWLNDNYKNTRKVTLDKVANPLSILSLIEIDEEPFNSSRFAFAVEDGKPVTYARNDFQIRFMDGDGRMTSANGSFTDMRVRRELEGDISEIKQGKNTFEIGKLPENSIKWFKLEGETGDSIHMTFSRGCMAGLYSPSAETLIDLQGADALAGASYTFRENGTYYLAVHDLNASNTKLDFFHIRKFAMLENSPNTSSPGGDIYMDILGNGFLCLENLSLVNGSVTIPAKEFTIKDNYNLCVQFDLKDQSAAPLGTYSLVANFTDAKGAKETVVKENAMSIAEAVPAEIEVKLNTPFRPATPYEVTIDITNKSNSPCWGVPVNFAVRRSQKGFAISFKDFYPCSNPDLAGLSDVFVVTDNLLGTHEPGYYFPTVVPYIGPKETITLTLGFRSNPHEKIRMYAWAGQPWNEEFDEILSPDFDLNEIADLQQSNILSAKALCYLYALQCESKDKSDLKVRTQQLTGKSTVRTIRRLENIRDLAQNNANVAVATGMALGGLTNGMRLHNLNATLEAYGVDLSDQTYSSLADYQNNLKQGMPTPGLIIGTAFGDDELGNAIDGFMNAAAESSNPMPEPHDFMSYQSGDPNEMKGYESASGSKYIGFDVKTVDYTIEFENDPEIANSPAMTVTVENTLDSKSFDLNSFTPRSIKIGDKTVELPAEHKFVKSIDMRPEINAIANLDFDYDPSTGSAKWVITSLDPLTLEESEYMYDGILPVNDESGQGTGYLTYSIDLLDGLTDGSEISNKAVIIFDNNSPIETPVWTNVTDYTYPYANIEEIKTDDNLTYTFKVNGEDSGSGIWFYDLYVTKAGSEKPEPVMANIESDEFTYTSDTPLEGAIFSIIATDRAGNRQDKYGSGLLIGDADGNGVVDANDVVVMRNYYLETTKSINVKASDVNNDGVIDAQDALTTRIIYLDTLIKQTRKQIRRK